MDAAPDTNDNKRTPSPDSWASLKRKLSTWDQPRLLGLLHDLFTTLPDARAAIAGRLMLDKPAAAKRGTLEQLRKRIRRAIWPTKNLTRSPDWRAARQISDQYLRATSDSDGTIALYVEMIVTALEICFHLGDMEDSFYESTWRAAEAVDSEIGNATDPVLLLELAGRVRPLRRHRNFPGWGMDELLESLIDALEDRARALSPPESSNAPTPA